LIEYYKDVLQSKPNKTKSTCIEIKTGDSYFIHKELLQRNYLCWSKKQKLFRERIIQPSNYEGEFPTILVPKPGGAVRLCID